MGSLRFDSYRSRASRRAVLDAARASGRAHATYGPDAARDQDELYDEHGMPA